MLQQSPSKSGCGHPKNFHFYSSASSNFIYQVYTSRHNKVYLYLSMYTLPDTKTNPDNRYVSSVGFSGVESRSKEGKSARARKRWEQTVEVRKNEKWLHRIVSRYTQVFFCWSATISVALRSGLKTFFSCFSLPAFDCQSIVPFFFFFHQV